MSPRFLRLTLALMLPCLTALTATADDGTEGVPPDLLYTCQLVVANTPLPPDTLITAATPGAPPPTVVELPFSTPFIDEKVISGDIEAATAAILGCMGSHDVQVLQQVTGPVFRGEWLGLGGPISDDELAALLPFLTPTSYELIFVSNIQSDGSVATATVHYLHGRQFQAAEWSFVLSNQKGKGVWRLERQRPLPVSAPANACELNLKITDRAMMLDKRICSTADIVIHVQNTGKAPHEALIIRSPRGGGRIDFAAASPGLPAGSTFIGQITVGAGDTETMVLLGVRPAEYHIIDLLPNDQGIPNVSAGFITTFTVED